jgi:hypothetical protein
MTQTPIINSDFSNMRGRMFSNTKFSIKLGYSNTIKMYLAIKNQTHVVLLSMKGKLDCISH